jgi:hypothetical protein
MERNWHEEVDDRIQKGDLECIFSRGMLLARIGVPRKGEAGTTHSNATTHCSPSTRIFQHRTVICDRTSVIQDFGHD